MDAENFSRMTSNQFLNTIGNPTKVEAEIGNIYNKDGLKDAFYYIEKKILPIYFKQQKKVKRQNRCRSKTIL